MTEAGVVPAIPGDIASLSVVVPGVTPECGPQSKTGPDSDVCQQMYFFATKAAAVKWSQDHPGVAILSVAEADEVARLLATPTVASDCC